MTPDKRIEFSSPATRLRHTSPASLAFLATALAWCIPASAEWTVVVLCPDEFPGPPDCFDCQIFGSTSAYDDDPEMLWWATDVFGGSPSGSFDLPDGFNVYFNHYNCADRLQTVNIQVEVTVFIEEIPDVMEDMTFVLCTGTGMGG
jgi:hypothetical protein